MKSYALCGMFGISYWGLCVSVSHKVWYDACEEMTETLRNCLLLLYQVSSLYYGFSTIIIFTNDSVSHDPRFQEICFIFSKTM